MQANNITNILTQAMKPSRFFVMLKKIAKRFLDRPGQHSREANLKWLESQCSDIGAFAASLDADLWNEALEISARLEQQAAEILKSIEFDLGGGGAYPFLYFVTRYMKPDCIVETGVAAGFSSSAFLSAIKKNGTGKLYSSDFPYFRISNPESYVGIVVHQSLRDDWRLYLSGDETNIPLIVKEAKHVDIFHYDSDKSYSGREFAISEISPVLTERAVIIMDDIQDNSYFLDYIENYNPHSWRVFNFHNKYVGIIGNLTRL